METRTIRVEESTSNFMGLHVGLRSEHRTHDTNFSSPAGLSRVRKSIWRWLGYWDMEYNVRVGAIESFYNMHHLNPTHANPVRSHCS
jgi:hypothetical protein